MSMPHEAPPLAEAATAQTTMMSATVASPSTTSRRRCWSSSRSSHPCGRCVGVVSVGWAEAQVGVEAALLGAAAAPVAAEKAVLRVASVRVTLVKVA